MAQSVGVATGDSGRHARSALHLGRMVDGMHVFDTGEQAADPVPPCGFLQAAG
jgi:hypothetical protein